MFPSFLSPVLSRGFLLNITNIGQQCLRNKLHSVVNYHANCKILANTTNNVNAMENCWSLTSIRTAIRDNWPRPSEKKRLQMRFWNRMKTRGGRAVLMRRYLKGRHVLSH